MWYDARCPLIFFHIFSDPLFRRARNRPKTSSIRINNLPFTTIFNVVRRARAFFLEEVTAGHRERDYRHI
jgi:hypothetical protein